MKEKIKSMVIESLEELKEMNNLKFEINKNTVLLGDGAIMDSFDFVNFIAILEEKISDNLDKTVTIVSEKAFSKKYSPFKTIDRIVDYIIELLAEEE